KQSIEFFLDELSSNKLVPGGGSAASLVAAIGIALGSMVGHLALSKKRYQSIIPEIESVIVKSEKLKRELQYLIEKDAESCETLLKAFKMPKTEREHFMDAALEEACTIPLEIMKKTIEAIDLHEQLLELGITTAISDIGVGVSFCKAALEGASLSIFINTKLMKNDGMKATLNEETDWLLQTGMEKANALFHEVAGTLK
ncbi:MAG: cyclodeaminase/cyclohydrolase family protein, partial [Bacillus sp. (in: firmicutes)]